jgi:serine/threonine-protein kinase
MASPLCTEGTESAPFDATLSAPGRPAARLSVRERARGPELPEVPAMGAIVDGKYRVEGKLGEGAMGVVLAAYHLEIGERLALKVLRPHLALRGGAARRFGREVKATFGLVAPNVVRTFDVGTTASGLPYVAMELLEGSDLAELLARKGPLETRAAARCVIEACDGLAVAHARGIVHRDVKPSNLFRAREGSGERIKVLDFGIAKLRPVDAREDERAAAALGHGSLTRTSDAIGSPSYMSPEQIRDPKCVDARTDVWSLGVTLFQLLTGELPFVAESAMSLSAAILLDPPRRLRDVRASAPAKLEAVVARCLEKDPAARYRSVNALAEALAPFAREAEPRSGDVARASAAAICAIALVATMGAAAWRAWASRERTSRVEALVDDAPGALEHPAASQVVAVAPAESAHVSAAEAASPSAGAVATASRGGEPSTPAKGGRAPYPVAPRVAPAAPHADHAPAASRADDAPAAPHAGDAPAASRTENAPTAVRADDAPAASRTGDAPAATHADDAHATSRADGVHADDAHATEPVGVDAAANQMSTRAASTARHAARWGGAATYDRE